MSKCVVLLCNKKYFDKFISTLEQLVTFGKYKGPICLVIGDDLRNDRVLDCDIIKQNNIIIKHFPDIQLPANVVDMQKRLNRLPHWIEKQFQYHKFHLFNTFFKQWDYILYLDCGISIFSDISPILNESAENTLLAHSDSYPTYEWKLHNQFDKTQSDFTKLNTTYDLNIDYCQSTIMLYDTKIIQENTYDEILNLFIEYPISITNDQGILALYFTNIKPVFKQIRTHNENTHFYDYLSRNNNRYIMLKTCWYA